MNSLFFCGPPSPGSSALTQKCANPHTVLLATCPWHPPQKPRCFFWFKQSVSFLGFGDGGCIGQPGLGSAEDVLWGLKDTSLGCFQGGCYVMVSCGCTQHAMVPWGRGVSAGQEERASPEPGHLREMNVGDEILSISAIL